LKAAILHHRIARATLVRETDRSQDRAAPLICIKT